MKLQQAREKKEVVLVKWEVGRAGDLAFAPHLRPVELLTRPCGIAGVPQYPAGKPLSASMDHGSQGPVL